MEIYLGAASFMYYLNILGRDFSISGEFWISLWLLDSKVFPFSINAENRESADCGYIPTNVEILKELFNENELKTIMSDCVRECNKATRTVAHCPISRDSKKRGTISIKIDRKDFNCRLKP